MRVEALSVPCKSRPCVVMYGAETRLPPSSARQPSLARLTARVGVRQQRAAVVWWHNQRPSSAINSATIAEDPEGKGSHGLYWLWPESTQKRFVTHLRWNLKNFSSFIANKFASFRPAVQSLCSKPQAWLWHSVTWVVLLTNVCCNMWRLVLCVHVMQLTQSFISTFVAKMMCPV